MRTKEEAREAVLRRKDVATSIEVDVDDDDVTDRVLALKIPKGEAFDE